ncbi:MAG: hypothetical protein CO186_09640 [Zetaproteobacteria bacterium CG_4_9_14_3_um_filter_49_83]|nr:MAG: hypothetical protein COW62_07790 [Zetaproteobacteria bacterium CG17_big_fil_post_rev_8_21_14_2_50_50_13]PIV30617.1 MAG: hypothetical protein COS35_05810 [Zetaproteobacteria bacterium CG02_land_8_20_14_3_00_50_9]PIY56964.1 MAG: hypothetical protein COZ00_01205 [Zetaproteobacteria bacterium CG_4_10_14_0_8_um_filter_49_80]PJA34631.1 MAG: hypothetical protein CO186_09640 [Zetaproteobacteria bacterium CG_4_9_14_3_um_filter_49_83]
MVFTMLMSGPHLLHNPYKIVVSKIIHSDVVTNRVGEIDRLELISTGEFNWHVVSYWRVFGSKSEGEYRTELDLDSRFTLNDEMDKKSVDHL